MFSVKDFVSKYEKYRNDKLMEMHLTIHEFGSDAQEALDIIIKGKGGLEKISNQLQQEETRMQKFQRK